MLSICWLRSWTLLRNWVFAYSSNAGNIELKHLRVLVLIQCFFPRAPERRVLLRKGADIIYFTSYILTSYICRFYIFTYLHILHLQILHLHILHLHTFHLHILHLQTLSLQILHLQIFRLLLHLQILRLVLHFQMLRLILHLQILRLHLQILRSLSLSRSLSFAIRF